MSDLPLNFGDIPPDPVPFRDRLSALCARELAAAHGDPERIGEMIERLAHALAFTCAMVGKGDPKQVDTLLTGVTSYLYEAAASHQAVGELMASARPGASR